MCQEDGDHADVFDGIVRPLAQGPVQNADGAVRANDRIHRPDIFDPGGLVLDPLPLQILGGGRGLERLFEDGQVGLQPLDLLQKGPVAVAVRFKYFSYI